MRTVSRERTLKVVTNKSNSFVRFLERGLFSVRPLVVVAFVILAAAMAFAAKDLRISAGFDKMLPQDHAFIQKFQEYRKSFGGGNRITIALIEKQGDIFNAEFFKKLKGVHDELFYLPGVYRPSVKSIYSPDVWYIDIVEGGYAGGAVVPPDFKPTPEMFARVKRNIVKGEQEGRLVANGLTGALVTADLQDKDPTTGEPVDYQDIARKLEDIRTKYQDANVSVHIVGFAKATGDIAQGAQSVIAFFFVTVVITALLLYWYTKSWRLAVLPLVSAIVSVICQFGVLDLFGYGLDPMNMLLPFLVIALGVSHGIQMVTQWQTGFLGRQEMSDGSSDNDPSATKGNSISAARRAFRVLAGPGIVAILTDVFGFLVLNEIDIPIIRELALTAAIGLGFIVVTNLLLLPVLLSYVNIKNYAAFEARFRQAATPDKAPRPLRILSNFGTVPVAIVAVIVAIAASIWGYSAGDNVQVGDVTPGFAELRPDSVYNRDVRTILDHFSVGSDVLTVYARTKGSGCVDYGTMSAIDDFVIEAKRLSDVTSVASLTETAKKSWVGYNEGFPKWTALPRDRGSLALITAYVEVGTGLLNGDCSVMPINIYTTDHRAVTVHKVVDALQSYIKANPSANVTFEFAGGNVGIAAATNESVKEAQFSIMVYIYGAIILLILSVFRSFKAVAAVVLPLLVVSFVAYIVMSALGIGLKVNTLPVASLGAGIGVDYGLYIFSDLRTHLAHVSTFKEAYLRTLMVTGRAVVFTGVTLSFGVATWIFSDLQFQADVGLMLTFKFLLSMIAAVTLLPAIAVLVGVGRNERKQGHIAA